IPFSSLGLKHSPSDGAVWRMNIARNDRINTQYSTWSPLERAFHEPANFGELQFLDDCPGVVLGQPRRSGNDLTWNMPVHGTRFGSVSAFVSLRTVTGQFDMKGVAGDTSQIELRAPAAWTPRAVVRRVPTIRYGARVIYRGEPLVCLATRIRSEQPKSTVPLTIGNDTVELVFDRTSGHLLRTTNRKAKLDVRFGERGTPIAELETVRFLRNPRFFRQDDVHTIVPGSDTLQEIAKSADAEGERLTIRHLIPGGIDLVLTVTVPKQGVETRWDIDLDNRRTLRPSQSLVVHRVRYPCIVDMPESLCGDAPHAVVPMMMGQRIPEPAKNLGRRRPYPYIGNVTQGWFDYSGASGGLYFMTGET
ncbi:MAG: hypothetical protein KAI66_09450, partial [Lentisphaeria bacterium]|nr:hypothetical protein [Lentisphaeria bacterium]